MAWKSTTYATLSAKGALRNTRTSMSGSEAQRAAAANPASSTMKPASSPSTRPLSQPEVLAALVANTRQANDPASRAN